MGTFSAASNVTGQLSDGIALAALLHRYGALAFFDYATAAPYVPMDMNPPVSSSQDGTVASTAADALFFSPHKCIGGVGTPGVLVCKKHLLSQTNAPGRSGGGTVFYVTHADHRFLSNRLERYEGGTPHVVGIWRAGLTMMVKRRVAQVYAQVAAATTASQQVPPTIVEFEYQTYERVAAYVQEHAPNLVLLGYDHARSSSQPHLPIFSFLIRCGSRFLHYNYVCAILNDVFGIQSRGGCQCAGPYSQRLLGLTTTNKDGLDMPNAVNRRLEQALLQYKERAELLRPGYSRLSLPFKGVRTEEVDYVCKAMVWVSKHAWALMCLYRCNHRTGEVCMEQLSL
jgi:selenocysteine lyase/cysteine desulfurase